MTPAASESEKLYIRLTRTLLERIRSGQWRPGTQIPTEGELCKGFGVSKITVRRAVDNLVFEGYLEKIQGKGTFVLRGRVQAGISMKTTLVEGVFLPGGHEGIAVLERGLVREVDEDTLARMGPVLDLNLYKLRRLKSSAGVPVLVNDTYVPLRMCPEIAGWDPEGGSVFEFLREHGTAEIAKVFQSASLARASEEQAELLKVRPGSACMAIYRVFRSASEVTVAYSVTVARGDRFELKTEYERVK